MTEKIGKFEVVELLGRGAMGVVYKGHDPSLARSVAIKVMTAHLEMDPELRTRFFREAQAAGSLQHPNIITIFELGESDGQPYIAMEYVPGRDLDDIIAAREPLTIVEKVDLIEQVCRGLSFAHERRIVHRDVKPANIRVTEMGQVKVMDFGVAHLVSSDLTATGSLVGTPYYMAPEVINGESVDARADIFSMGATFYELLSYTRPFQGDNLQSVFRKILHEDPPPLRELGLEVPPVLQEVLDRSLAKRPRDRYSDTGDFLKDLMTFWETLPAPAQARAAATTALGRAASKAAKDARRRWGWKRLVPLAAGAAIGLAGLLIVGGAFFGTAFFEPAEPGARSGQVAAAERQATSPEGAAGREASAEGSPESGSEAGEPASPAATEGSPGPADEPGPATGGTEERVAEPDRADAAATAEANRIARARSAYESARRAAEEERGEAEDLDAARLAATPFARGEAAMERGLRAADAGRYSEAESEMRRAERAYSDAGIAAASAWRGRLDSARARMDSLRALAEPDAPQYERAERSLRAAAEAEGAGRYREALRDLATASEAFRQAVAPPVAEAEPTAEPEAPAEPSTDEIVRIALEELRRAIEAEDPAALRRVWVGLTAEELKSFESFFESMRDLEVSFDIESMERSGDRIHLKVQTVYDFINEGTRRRVRQPFTLDLELAPQDGHWVIVSSRS